MTAHTGIRWGELAGLRVADINLLRRRLTIRSSLVEPAGELPQLGPAKSAASERTISLLKVVVDTIASHASTYAPVDGVIWTTEMGELLRRALSAGPGAKLYPIPSVALSHSRSPTMQPG